MDITVSKERTRNFKDIYSQKVSRNVVGLFSIIIPTKISEAAFINFLQEAFLQKKNPKNQNSIFKDFQIKT